MKRDQIYKILKVAFVATLLMFLFEVLFSIPGVNKFISSFVQSIEQRWILWIVIWLIMFVQVCFIPIPAYIVLSAAMYAQIINPKNGLLSMFGTFDCWLFILLTLSAYIVGAIVAYWMGWKWGRKAIKWCAGSNEEYDKWASMLNKKGKWWYATSIILPIFPDDLLCLVAGSVKFNFKFFTISNIIGRGVGLICMIGTLAIMQSTNNNGIPWTMIGWGTALLFISILLLIIKKKIKKETV